MSIIVIDLSPELYWFVSSSLLVDEIPLKHFQTALAGEKYILQEFPAIVIINGDDKTIEPSKFINRMRNLVFARSTIYIVVTSDMSIDFKKELLMAGAAQILYRGIGFTPSTKYFNSMIKWFQTKEEPDPQIFEYKPVAFPAEGEFTSDARLGWISATHCMIETNINLSPGQKIDCKFPLFAELEIENVQLECIEKNQVGRYYQYANSLKCKINSKNSAKDEEKIKSWVGKNFSISRHKPIKIIYFEPEATYRDEIQNIIKEDARYCARGFISLDDVETTMDIHLPHLILINRALIEKDKIKFEAIKGFIKKHLCYCITYDSTGLFNVEEYKKNYEFAMHINMPMDIKILESMIKKLESKLPEDLKTDSWKIYLNKNSPYTRISLHSPCKIKEITVNGVSLNLPFSITKFCACEISTNAFSAADMSRSQFFRCFTSKVSSGVEVYRFIFMGQSSKDGENLKKIIDKLTEVGYARWIVGDV